MAQDVLIHWIIRCDRIHIDSYTAMPRPHYQALPHAYCACSRRMNQTRTLPMYIILYNVTCCIQPSVDHHTYTLISTYTHLPSLYNCFLSACSTFVPSLVATFILFTKCLFHHAL